MGPVIRLAKLWCHECRRVLADRLITIDETKIIDEMIGECHADHLKKQGVSADVLLNDAENANIYTTFTARSRTALIDRSMTSPSSRKSSRPN